MTVSNRITLKRFRSGRSEETIAFSADVYLDGKLLGQASNSGQGESIRWEPPAMEAMIDAVAKTLPPRKTHYGDLPMDAELLVFTKADEEIARAELKRKLKTRVLYVPTGSTELHSTQPLHHNHSVALADPEINKKLRSDRILNFMTEDEALEIYYTVTRQGLPVPPADNDESPSPAMGGH